MAAKGVQQICDLENLIMGVYFSFHILVSDSGLLKQNTCINQTKRCQQGQFGMQQLQWANKSKLTCSLLQVSTDMKKS